MSIGYDIKIYMIIFNQKHLEHSVAGALRSLFLSRGADPRLPPKGE